MNKATELITAEHKPFLVSEAAKDIAKHENNIRANLPRDIDSRQFWNALVLAANTMKPCTKKSIIDAAYNCATLGLIPGPALGHAYFVPFRNGKESERSGHDVYDCVLVIGYRGFFDLAYGSGFLSDIHMNVVLKGEEYKHWNDASGPQLMHTIPLKRDMKFENVDAAYCIYHTTAGGHGIKVVPKSELDKLYQRFKGKKYRESAWDTDPIPMCMKTAGRWASKEWKLTGQLALAVHLDEQAERGELQSCAVAIDAPKTEAEEIDFEDFTAKESQAFTDLKRIIEGLDALEGANEMDKEIDFYHAEDKITVPERESLRAILMGRLIFIKKTLGNEEN